MQDYIDKIYELIPAVIVAIFGGLSGEIIRGDKKSRSGKGDISRLFSYLIVWIFSGLMAWALIIDLDLPLGAKVLIIGLSSFVSKEFLSALSACFMKRFNKYLESEKGNKSDDK